MSVPTKARWCCRRCGHCWPSGNPPPGAFARCECPYPRPGDLLLTWDSEPKAEATDRLEQMAAQAILITEARMADERLDLESVAAEGEKTRLQELVHERDEARAEVERLSVIVDLAVAEYAAGVASEMRYDCNHGWSEYHAARSALSEAVWVEVGRRASGWSSGQ